LCAVGIGSLPLPPLREQRARVRGDGALLFYQLGNIVTRSETPSEPRTLYWKTQEARVGNPQLRIIVTRTGFHDKIDRVFTGTGGRIGVNVSQRPVRTFPVAKDVRPRVPECCVTNVDEF
jgi:hypothetical protein